MLVNLHKICDNSQYFDNLIWSSLIVRLAFANECVESPSSNFWDCFFLVLFCLFYEILFSGIVLSGHGYAVSREPFCYADKVGAS